MPPRDYAHRINDVMPGPSELRIPVQVPREGVIREVLFVKAESLGLAIHINDEGMMFSCLALAVGVGKDAGGLYVGMLPETLRTLADSFNETADRMEKVARGEIEP